MIEWNWTLGQSEQLRVGSGCPQTVLVTLLHLLWPSIGHDLEVSAVERKFSTEIPLIEWDR